MERVKGSALKYLYRCLTDEVKEDWTFVNVSRSSGHQGEKKTYYWRTFSDACARFAELGVYGKVNKVIMQYGEDTTVEFYIGGGIFKHGHALSWDSLRVYVDGERVQQMAVQPG